MLRLRRIIKYDEGKRKVLVWVCSMRLALLVLAQPLQAQGKQCAREQRIRIQRSRKADPVCVKGRDDGRPKRSPDRSQLPVMTSLAEGLPRPSGKGKTAEPPTTSTANRA